MAEGARLESVCALTGYRGFESLPLRQIIIANPGRVALSPPGFFGNGQWSMVYRHWSVEIGQ